MKYGTALRVARVALTVAIVVILVFPLVSSIASTNVKEMKPGIESTYDLNFGVVDDNTYKAIMKTNLAQIGDTTEGIPFDGIAFDGGNPEAVYTMDGAVSLIFDHKSTNKTATVYNDGKICTQKTIQYHNGLETIVKTGMKVPDNIGGLASFDVSLSFVGKNVEYSIPYGSGEIINNYLVITTKIPDLLNILCNSTDQDMEFKVHVSVLALANFDVDVDIFTGHTVEASYDDTHKALTFTNTAVGTPNEVSVGTGNLVKYQIQSNGIKMWSVGETVLISKQLADACNGDGTLTISATGCESITISADQVNDIIKIVKYLEERE